VGDLGGIVVEGDEVVFELALPIAGMMSGLPPFAEVVEQNRRRSRRPSTPTTSSVSVGEDVLGRPEYPTTPPPRSRSGR
jgi:hypothetical protein